MAKIHPNNTSSPRNNSSSSSSNCFSSSLSERETFTVWMKSLVFHGNGCTTFNSKGEVVFRVDNYQQKCSSKVLLMDTLGQILFSIHRKKLRIFGCWEGFKSSKVDKEKPWFQVRRNHTNIFSKKMSCKVILKNDQNSKSYYRIIGLEAEKSTIKIMDFSGQLLAEAIQKQSSKGVPLGEDVLTLMVEPHADQSLIMALLTVYGLINNKL